MSSTMAKDFAATRHATVVRQMFLLVHLFGLILVSQYLGYTQFDEVNISNIDALQIDGNFPVPQPKPAQEKAREKVPATASQVAVSTTKQLPDNVSILQYKACCGLGHRLGRQWAVYHSAHKLRWKLDVQWPGCGGVNVFDQLFHPESEAEMAYINSTTHEFFVVANEAEGYTQAKRNCLQEELQSHYDMYSSLKRRFRPHVAIDSFVEEHFKGHFAIGIHVRAGNGETGDFMKKKRQMAGTPQSYTQQVSKNIQDWLQKSGNTLPPVLFIATDTASYVDLFRTELEGVMPVVQWEQQRDAAGSGVFVGMRAKGSEEKDAVEQSECLQKWTDMLSDMILLASTDLLIAGHYSSFSQTMPLSVVLGKHENQQEVRESYCEVYNEGEDMGCFTSQMDWCLNTQHARNGMKRLGENWPVFLEKMYAHKKYHKESS